MAKFDAKAISKLDWGVIGAGGITLIALFLPWWGFSEGIYSASVSGFSSSWGWLGALLVIAAGVYQLAHRSQVDLTKVPFGPAVIVLGASGLGTLIVLLRWLTIPSAHYGVGADSYSYGPRIGLILTVIVGLVQVGCAVQLFRSSGEALPWADKAKTGDTPPSA
jgi:hypothetical protein